MFKFYAYLFLSAVMPTLMFAQVPTGFSAKYELNTNATDIGPSAYNGTLSSTTSTANRLGTASSATAFVSGTGSGTLPVALETAIQNNFSIGFWFKTVMTGPTGTQWYNGASLIDAEVSGVANDWGIGLIDGGKVAFGIGNPDMTIKSNSAVLNNNAWHFVTGTRNMTAGTFILYIDGVAQTATGSAANTAALSAPSVIGLGRSSAVTTGSYTGSLDDIITYNRVLTPAEVTNLYNALVLSALPLTWLSFTGTIKENNIVLSWQVEKNIDNDYFEIETSKDGVHFSVEGLLHNSEGVATASTTTYTFSSVNVTGGVHYYRLKQTDKDGQFTYSKTIQLTMRGLAAALHIQTNPVAGILVLVNHNQDILHHLQITDMAGRVISNKVIQSNSDLISVDVNQLQTGYYLVRVFTNNGNHSLPLIKQ